MQLKYTAFKKLIPCLLVIFLVSIIQTASSQSINLSINDVLQKVQTNLPQLEALRQQAKATEQNIALAKNTIIPNLNAGYQLNEATYNNITGMSYPGFYYPLAGRHL